MHCAFQDVVPLANGEAYKGFVENVPDEPSTSNYEPEPPRPKTIPDDFIWVPEDQAWYAAPALPSVCDEEHVRMELDEKRRQ